MELKFLLLVTLFVLFAAFGSIETGPSGSASSTNSDSSSTYHTGPRFNSSSALRPWGTVPPPRDSGNYTVHDLPSNITVYHSNHPGVGNRAIHHPRYNATVHRPICTDYWSIDSPCRPFATVPPPIYPGPWYPDRSYPRNKRHGHRRNSLDQWIRLFRRNGTKLGRFVESSNGVGNNSTKFYPLLAGVKGSLREMALEIVRRALYGTDLQNTTSEKTIPGHPNGNSSFLGSESWEPNNGTSASFDLEYRNDGIFQSGESRV